jgi:hypothetical protein
VIKINSTFWENTTPTFKAQIIGKLLGDGSMTKQEGRKPRFQFIHAEKDYQWTFCCYKMLGAEIPLSAPKYKKVTDTRLVKGFSTAYYVQSKTSDVITFLRNEWYPIRKKIIPFTLIEKYFTVESLAWWYMDDGHLNIKDRIPRKIILSTESFLKEHNLYLMEFLKRRFMLTFSLDRQNRLILYDQFHIMYFLYLIQPHLHHDMHRKQIPQNLYSFAAFKRRTTVYLPNFINILKPTHEINMSLENLSEIIKVFKSGLFYDTYQTDIVNLLKKKQQNSFQIVITESNINNLSFLKYNTGLTYSQLTHLCFISSIKGTQP